ncbi:MAG: bifunctional DNA-formamidopyrimidine glycosylase/DNA-(apurinic or apyrimidinic site) lyase [Nigerium sp.]|nr:bifunctional DNA-formamidopyrimidine glycosylase/DNA-(apurinic or apyrimidinic site) lyase [Nigerium sp.]
MPELPEVEVVRRGLEPVVRGRRIEAVTVLHPRPVRRCEAGPDAFAALLRGRTFGAPRRRGKYLWFPLADGDALLAHLGMSGQFRVDRPDAERQRHARVLFDLDDGVQVRFVDQRMFGGLSLSPGGAALPPEIAHLGRDLFDPDLDLDALVAAVGRRSSAVKRVLLDQKAVSGIGNIYADEALWRAGVHHQTPACELGPDAVRALLVAARDVMADALATGGTSFDALYVNVNGESGYFDRSLEVYGREGEPCRRCGCAIRRVAFMNRSSHFCPRCQRLR